MKVKISKSLNQTRKETWGVTTNLDERSQKEEMLFIFSLKSMLDLTHLSIQ